MIIDIHTHIFPPAMRDQREAFIARDATFREMYAHESARIATAEELLASMDEAGVDVSVACGFGWTDAELCKMHNDYLLEAAEKSGGRIVPFCTVQPADAGAADEIARCAVAGARGLGELRPDSQGYRLEEEVGEVLAAAAREHRLSLLFHVSEPVGHVYPGKAGLAMASLLRFAVGHPDVTVVGAHWGGGLPFYALAPEIEGSLSRTFVDTAATSFLYRSEVYQAGSRLLGPDRVLFGSDFPLVAQGRALEELRGAPLVAEARTLMEGENARRLLGIG